MMVPAVKAIYLALLVLVASSSFSSHHQQVKGDKYEDEDDYYDSRAEGKTYRWRTLVPGSPSTMSSDV
ncbi:hypothetical protein AND_005081 [Anopheles darlingi]|uniref:Uncharacterized protein n=1 Tax=Anopheles darlingi TaxID=43151 RepID=W5JKC6_ANODA|nr:hypothetical protein AND_005081 [Anopheles darlingi]